MSDVHDASYYAKCMVGGIFACGITHAVVCPLDIVKCRRQVSISVQTWTPIFSLPPNFVAFTRSIQTSPPPLEMVSGRSMLPMGSRASPS